MNTAQEKLISDLLNPFKLNYFFLTQLPAAWFMGVRLKTFTEEKAEVSLKYSWWSKNPYRSTYFAAQCAAGEFSTGVLATLALAGQPSVAILVTNQEATFSKKASDVTTFTCSEGAAVQATVQRAIETKQPQSIRMTSIGTNKAGQEVSRIYITWSFKAR
ncbi:MAG: hypothetical protein RLZZ292_1435 [Bacteroidota bacterium]|jgi:hypothetical protein